MNEIARTTTGKELEGGARSEGSRLSPLEKAAPPILQPEPEMRVERSKPTPGAREALEGRRGPRRRPLWKSPLTRRILAVNIVALFIPVVGLLYLDNYRQSLIESELELLKTEGKLFSGALAASGVVTGPLGEERLLPETTRQTVRRLVDVSQTRARLFSPDGSLIADSFLLSGPGGVVEMQPLAPLNADDSFLWRAITGIYDWIAGLLPDSKPLPPYAESTVQSAQDYEEVQKSLAGETATAVRDAGGGRLILSVAVPVQRYRQVLGALFLTKPGDSIEAIMRDTRLTILGVFAVALSVTVLLSLYLGSTIAWPMHRLADAAERVRRAKGRQVKIPDLSHRKDEIGELSGALRDMTQAVWKRMDAIERFAADVSHEIKNPLTSLRSAVETAARIDDPVQQRRLMTIILDDVQRLNRLITDISDASRIDAEMSRADAEPVSMRELLTAIADIYGATVDADAPRIEVIAREGDSLMVLGMEGRLGQVLRNLVSNAVSFSPPGGVITLTGWREHGHVLVTVEDNGPGIPPDKLKAIFERFYSERPEGEKFGTHSGLGLSISHQIVEAHGGTLTADNMIGPEGNVRGACFTIELPAY
ncbi:stimulus-sensing domain-containing protein [Dongia deserti]|uniref:stimulus-sensing domain-containing protein n=1 Tax=Dongia deserti TaxID=2268030 RepID=UPI0025493825|nr:stimulus-sensing domain-containing protein [Dongia deserti]